MNLIYQKLQDKKKLGQKSFSVLLDPDKLGEKECIQIVNLVSKHPVDFFFIGGSLLVSNSLDEIIHKIKSHSSTPIVLFPGNNHHLSKHADGILFLSLISGRNPEFLIGQHVIAAPFLKNSNLEILPTGYLLIDCGNATTVSYMSNTTPIPYLKNDIAVCTALAGEMLGLKLIFLDGGSGAKKSISKDMIAEVSENINIPLIIGGGITTKQEAFDALTSGADMIVVGNGIEQRKELLSEISSVVETLNHKASTALKK